ncbi:hypothetical protein AgCh_017320 [Apium graveolens]
MRQRRWLELIKDYDYSINYHPGKANVVADALSMKERLNEIKVSEGLARELEKLEIEEKKSVLKEIAKVLYPPGEYQNLSRLKKELVVARNEEGDCGLCQQMSRVSDGKGKTSKAKWIIATLGDSLVEMGRDCNGFRSRIAKDKVES